MSHDAAIRIEGLGKRYRLGSKETRHDTFMGAALALVRAPLENIRRLRALTRFDANDDDVVWALQDVSFEVKRGEVVGIVGHNGAGKSTLLKILSRITEPSTGYAELWGRLASLLEVGTGFHPDLTGRENLYLNGAILGMTREEIDRRFDEIVAFSEVERFLDTPVKRYSSGMKVRLAFAVAAHLEAEILLIDEVLAVGDAAFQRKCLGKMEDVAGRGRTVFFVSHNMAAIRSLCQRVIWFDRGRLRMDGRADDVADEYMARAMQPPESGRAAVSFCTLDVRIAGGASFLIKPFGTMDIDITLTATDSIAMPGVYAAILSADQNRLAGLDLRDFVELEPLAQGQSCTVRFHIEDLPFVPGQYFLEIYAKDMAGPRIEKLEQLFPFEVAETAVYGAKQLTRWHGHCALRATVSTAATEAPAASEVPA